MTLNDAAKTAIKAKLREILISAFDNGYNSAECNAVKLTLGTLIETRIGRSLSVTEKGILNNALKDLIAAYLFNDESMKVNCLQFMTSFIGDN